MEIAATLRDEILSGQYRVGERLPSERDLSQRFESSRGAVREALKKLEQLGVAAINPGGVRVAPIEECTLDVLGPLLDLNEIPDPKRVDEVLRMFGMMLDLAAREAMEKSSDEQLDEALQIVDELLQEGTTEMEQHLAMRRLCFYFVELSDNLVMRLTFNGLSLTFLERIHQTGFTPERTGDLRRGFARELQKGLRDRDVDAVVDSMRRMNLAIRQRIGELLVAARDSRRQSA
jgi:DNA-binding FadR family transcriptional regulator